MGKRQKLFNRECVKMREREKDRSSQTCRSSGAHEGNSGKGAETRKERQRDKSRKCEREKRDRKNELGFFRNPFIFFVKNKIKIIKIKL